MIYKYILANICIERQILAYHKNLLSVTCPSISQLSCILPPPHKKSWQIERKITVYYYLGSIKNHKALLEKNESMGMEHLVPTLYDQIGNSECFY